MSLQKGIGFSPQSEFFPAESFVPLFLVGFQNVSMIRAYLSILQQFEGNLNCK